MPRPLSAEAREKAVDAALSLLTEGGISGFTLDAVAQRSGVAKTTLYRHWGSANVLMVHALDCTIERIPTPNTGDLRTDLRNVLGELREIANSGAHRQMMFEVMAAAANDPDLAAVQQALMHERTRPLRELIQRAVDRGEIPPVDLDEVTICVEGPFMARVLKSSEPVTAGELEPMIEFVARGLGAPPQA
ncbi:MAG: TetR/AcrR family transcriptional regulator [Actinomycetota bacterium]